MRRLGYVFGGDLFGLGERFGEAVLLFVHAVDLVQVGADLRAELRLVVFGCLFPGEGVLVRGGLHLGAVEEIGVERNKAACC